MEGMGIWIFLLLFYLLQAFAKRKQKQQRQQQSEGASPKPQSSNNPRSSDESRKERTPEKPQRPVSLEDLFNPNKLRDILGVPQPEHVEERGPAPQPVVMRKAKPEMRKRWEEPEQHKPSLQHEKVRETVSRVASENITDVDESATDFKLGRLGKSDITSDRFDVRKEAPGKKKKTYTLEYFDEPEDIRNAVILKEILDRPRAFRRQIR